jgi:hypothetical protein
MILVDGDISIASINYVSYNKNLKGLNPAQSGNINS